MSGAEQGRSRGEIGVSPKPIFDDWKNAFIGKDRFIELLRRALVDSDRKVLRDLLVNTTNFRWAYMLWLQYIANHLEGKCRNCSSCCKNEGLVGLYEADVRKIAYYLKMPVERFKRRYVKRLHGKIFLRRLPCAFLKEGRCSIYPARPITCAMYPFLSRHQLGFLEGKTDLVIIPNGCSCAERAYTLVAGSGRIYRSTKKRG